MSTSEITRPALPVRLRESWQRWDVRRRGLALMVVAALLLAAGAWSASLVIDTPRDLEANASAPPPSLITVPVVKRRVGEEIVTRGLVTATQTVEAVSEFAGADAIRALVSGKVPVVGDEVDHGAVVVEISGRPVIALQGGVPAYRSLGLGDTGSDVRQLNSALSAAGFDTSARSSRFDATTRRAVMRLFAASGYSSDGSLRVGEVAFVSALPASITGVSAALGTPVAESSVEIASGELAVSVAFSAAESALVRPGASVVLSSEILGKSVEAKIEGPATPRSSRGEAGAKKAAPAADEVVDHSPSAPVRIVPVRRLPSEWAGQDVKVRVVSAETADTVLAVPVTAVVGDASGNTEVVVVRKGATTITDADPRRVRVTVGVVGGGWAEVTPVGDATLEVGDPVQLSAPSAED